MGNEKRLVVASPSGSVRRARIPRKCAPRLPKSYTARGTREAGRYATASGTGRLDI
jgi:hypothetical protein